MRAQTAASQPPQQASSSGNGMAPAMASQAEIQRQQMNAMQNIQALRAQRIADMQQTVDQMHELVKDMRARVAATNPKAHSPQMENVQLWEMMLAHLDKTLAQARETTMPRPAMTGSNRTNRRGMMYQRPTALPALPAGAANGSQAASAATQQGPTQAR